MVKNGGKIIAPVSVQRWALTSDMDGLLDFRFDIYDITCNDCGEHYIGETARTLEKRLGEHQKQTTSAIREHQSQANHEIDWEGFKILDKESVDVKRKKEKSRRPSISDVNAQR